MFVINFILTKIKQAGTWNRLDASATKGACETMERTRKRGYDVEITVGKA